MILNDENHPLDGCEFELLKERPGEVIVKLIDTSRARRRGFLVDDVFHMKREQFDGKSNDQLARGRGGPRKAEGAPPKIKEQGAAAGGEARA